MSDSEVPMHLVEEREKCLTLARKSEFLDAVFIITYFNYKKSWQGVRIDPAEVLGARNQDELKDATIRATKLLTQNAYVGAAFFKYKDCHETFEESVRRLKDLNPGFSEESYRTAIGNSIFAMR